jgi:hypothetical protein
MVSKMSQEVEHKTKIGDTPKDGKWYSCATDQYIRWDATENQWDFMILREGSNKPEYWCNLPDGTELVGV